MITRDQIINCFIYRNSYKKYLEIGLDDCSNYLRIDCENKESCDPYSIQETSGEQRYDKSGVPEEVYQNLTYWMTSDEMFATMPQDNKYDIIFIDGLHTKEQVYKDLRNAYKHLNVGGTIILHDFLPTEEDHQRVPRVSGIWNGDVWKVGPVLKLYGVQFYTVDTDFGCCVIPYQQALSGLPETTGPLLEYNQVFTDKSVRNNVLNVVSENEFLKKLLKN